MIPYIDMHCDTLSRAYFDKKSSILQMPDYMVDIIGLKDGACRAQFFAIFMHPESEREVLGEAFPEDFEYIKGLIQIFQNNMQEHPEYIAEARGLEDVQRNAATGKISGILSVEDGRWVNGRMENIDWLYREGVRMMALTWNFENCFGYPNSTDSEIRQKGLKPFGKEAVLHMNDLGMIVDVSHLSDGGFWDVAQISTKPFVASHSNCRALSPHQRNLTDDMIRALAEKGGVMGLNFCPRFLDGESKGTESNIAYMMEHLKHMVKVGGIETAAIGTDFDGIGGKLEIPQCSRMPLLFDSMYQYGFSTEQIEKIAYKNVERVLGEC